MSMREKIWRTIQQQNLDNGGVAIQNHEAMMIADAVIDALMEPTEGMIKAVEEDYYMGKKGCPTCGGGRPAFTALIRAAKEGK